jgi:hypothetical protein
MTYNDITPVMRGFIGGREAFRRLGFSADDLFLQIARSATHKVTSCFVTLRTQGKEFPSNTCVSATAINHGEVSSTDLDRIWKERSFS